MNNKTATRILIGLLALIAIIFAAFYYFFIRNESGDGSSGIVITDTNNPVYPPSGGFGGTPNSTDSDTIPGRGSVRDSETEGGSEGDGTGGVSVGGVVNSVPITSLGSVFRIFDRPVSGVTSFLVDSRVTIRFVERELGNIYDYRIGGNQATRIANETIPRVQEAFFTNGGTGMIARYLDRDGVTIQTYNARLVSGKATSSLYSLEGSFLPTNITQLAVSPSGTSVLYTTENNAGGRGYVFSPTNRTSTLVFDSPAREWLPVWSNDRDVVLMSRPTYNIPGYIYTIDTKTETVSEFLPPKRGAMVLGNPDTSLALTLETGNGLLSRIIDLQTSVPLGTSVRTLPEKCVWDPRGIGRVLYCGIPLNPSNATLPDDWYMGATSYNDEIWRIDVKNYSAERVASINQFTLGPVDVSKPLLTADGKYFVFINRKDLTLWGVRVAE